jgi:6-pyruvoyltetrahydropterin/6-carboxytetrahydropterin synthase
MKIHTERKFDAAHLLPGYDGPCGRLHGHTWRVVVEVEGDIDPETNMVVDFRAIKQVVDRLDHKCLNDIIEYPTAENLVKYFLTEFGSLGPNIRKVLVRVYESEDCYAEGVVETPGSCEGIGVSESAYSATK